MIPMTKIRVLVIEDSLTIRKRIVEVLGADPELEVVGEGADGKTAIELVERLRPDVITLDMMLPVMTGLAATEYIMAHRPTPILVVSASTNRGELFRTYEALAAGAVDVLDKPLGTERDDVWERKLVATVKLVSRIKVITHLRAKLTPSAMALRASPLQPHAGSPFRAVAIGVSTGGPSALQEILRALRPDFPIPLLVVLHIAEPFGAAFAEWLDGQSPIRVRYARDGEALPGGPNVVLAPPNRHLVVRGGRLRLTDDPERHSCRPSVDTLFESVALELGNAAIGCLLTGMGKDGAAGLLAMRRAGATTIAQDEETSVVFGMPREAILLSAAMSVLPLQEVAPTLAALAARPEGK